jgi:hypothetical protein
MVMLNGMDRFHFVMDMIDRVSGLGTRSAQLRQPIADGAPPAPRLQPRGGRRPARRPRLDVAGG